MTVRIEQITQGDTVELHIEGDLVGEAVEVLREELHKLATVEALSLDVSDVRFVDREGADVLNEVTWSGHALTGMSPYLRLLMGSNPQTVPADGVEANGGKGSLTENRDREGRQS